VDGFDTYFHFIIFAYENVVFVFLQTFQRFGSQVTILVRGPKILEKEDEDAARVVEQQLVTDGVRILRNCRVLEVRQGARIGEAISGGGGAECDGGTHGVEVSLSCDVGENMVIEGSKLLVATGRRPTVLGMNLEAGNVQYSQTDGIEVNDNLRSE
jgi:pyruvate/2-oxoglutarate dehydrogenase complex dihydrolipoamide dehydrogenase (E3) component